MTKIQELVDKFRAGYHTGSIIAEFRKRRKSNRFSEESSRTIQELGNIELYELGEISKTVQCQACLNCAPESLIYCSCGVCLMTSPEQKKRIKIQFEVMSVPYYLVRVDYSRGSKHGENTWQKKTLAKKGARKHNHDSMERRWINDATYRARPKSDGQKNFVDILTTSQGSTSPSWQPGNSDPDPKKSLVLGVNDGPHPGPMRGRDDFPQPARRREALQREQGRVNVDIPKNERERQRPSNEILRSDLMWHSKKLESPLVAGILLIFNSQQNGTNHTMQNGKANSGGESKGYRLFQAM